MLLGRSQSNCVAFCYSAYAIRLLLTFHSPRVYETLSICSSIVKHLVPSTSSTAVTSGMKLISQRRSTLRRRLRRSTLFLHRRFTAITMQSPSPAFTNSSCCTESALYRFFNNALVKTAAQDVVPTRLAEIISPNYECLLTQKKNCSQLFVARDDANV